jgi:uncharacterized RDD family membrane protein YckC
MAQIQELEITTPTGVDIRLRLAGPGARGYAFTVDFLIRLVVAAGVWIVANTLWPDTGGVRRGAASNSLESLHTIVNWLIPLALFFLYHPVLEWAGAGRTPGKRLAGVAVVDLSGHVPRGTAILVRNAFRLVDSLPAGYAVGLVTCLYSRLAQRLGDMAAGTVLVYARAEVDATAFDDRALAATIRPDVAVARELLRRWPELDAAYRRTLALRLLSTRLAADHVASDAELEAGLEALVDGR